MPRKPQSTSKSDGSESGEESSKDDGASDSDSEEGEEDGLIGDIQQILAVKGEGTDQQVFVKYRGVSSLSVDWLPGRLPF